MKGRIERRPDFSLTSLRRCILRHDVCAAAVAERGDTGLSCGCHDLKGSLAGNLPVPDRGVLQNICSPERALRRLRILLADTLART